MATSPARSTTGQITWTRDLARDLFPGAATPFAWTTLRAPAEVALRRALTELGAPEPAVPGLWRCDEDGQVYVNATALAEASRALLGAAWLGSLPGEPPVGLIARLLTSNVFRKAQATVAAAVADVAKMHNTLAAWLEKVRRLRWTQADLLQVMEELEPKARVALQTHFTLRAGLSAAVSQVAARLAEWLPDRPPGVTWGLYTGLAGLPGVETAYTLAAAAGSEASSAAALVRFGHRGPDEMRPDAARWGGEPELMAELALHRPVHNPDTARMKRQAIEAWVFGQLDAARGKQFESVLRSAQELVRATDIAWDAVTMVIAAAQAWLRATALEAQTARLIVTPSDALYLELEELKQVVTGEWHGGYSDTVSEEVARRRTRPVTGTLDGGVFQARLGATADGHGASAFIRPHPRPISGTEDQLQPASPGQARGPAYLASPTASRPPPGAIWLVEAGDAGCAPFWVSAGALVTAAADPWSPGLIVARSLGVPIVVGAALTISRAKPGQTVAVDGDKGQVQLEEP